MYGKNGGHTVQKLMKVIIQHKGNPRTGKGLFVSRLIPALRNLGVEVSGNIIEKSDIALHIGRVHYKSRAKKNVLRLGPAHVNTAQNYKKLNAEKFKSVKTADAIIYQSKYSKKVCHKFIGKTHFPETVIFNGADPNYYAKFDSANSVYRHNLLATTRKWIPQKRLKWIIRAFQEVNEPDSCLWIAGNPLGFKQKGLPNNIKFLGLIGQDVLARYYALCSAVIHIVYLDACPNSVVEALVAECSVICTDQGGTHEVVKSCGEYLSNCRKGACYYGGEIIKDKPYNFRPINLEKPPKPNMDDLVFAMSYYCQDIDDRGTEATHLYINNIAKQYVTFFETLL
jgi:glycosyltransferase involved in cell wall biosynthesis